MIYFVIHPKNAIQSFKSLFHWWPCISSYTSMSSMSLGITWWANYSPGFPHFWQNNWLWLSPVLHPFTS